MCSISPTSCMVDNAQPIHQTIENVETFSMALANNSGGVDAALKGLADLGKTIEPLADAPAGPVRRRRQAGQGDRHGQGPRHRRQCRRACRGRPTRCWTGPTSSSPTTPTRSIRRCRTSARSRRRSSDNRSNIDAALKGLADLGKTDPAARAARCRPCPKTPTSRQGDRRRTSCAASSTTRRPSARRWPRARTTIRR